MRGWLCIVLLAGCYNPTFQPGRPCTEDGYCPGDQRCDLTQSPPTCVEGGGPGDPDGGADAPVDSSLMPDGPVVACGAGCPAALPICEQGTQTCRACIADAECPSDVCHELTGECVAEADAMYVTPSGAGTTCTRTAPCGTIDAANQLLTATRRTVKVTDGMYDERLELRSRIGASSIVISGPDRSAAGPELTTNDVSNKTGSGISVVIEGITIRDTEGDGLEAQGPVTLARVHIRGAGGTGVVSRGSSLRIVDSTIEASAASGVIANGGTVEIERTSILSNAGGGLRIDGGTAYSVINSVIAFNGTVTTTIVAGVRILGAVPSSGPQVFKFNTVARNRSAFGVSPGFECGRPVTITSSIMANSSGLLGEMTGMCTATNSLFEQNPPNMGGNIAGDPMFVSMTDCHLLAGSPAVDAAQSAGAPSVDIDGDSRSGNDAPDIGADELP